MTKKSGKKDPFADREASKYERPIQSREFILEHLKQRGKPATFEELLREFQLQEDPELEHAFKRRLKAMIREEQLERLRGGFFWPAGHRTLVEGHINIEKGKKPKMWVVPEDGSPRISLDSREVIGVYHGNRVIVSILDLEDFREGHLVEVLEQQRMTVTGRFCSEPGFNYVIPHGKEISIDILIPQGKENGAKEGDIVIVEITTQPSHWAEPLGKICDVLGHEDNAGIEVLAATHAYNLPDQWDETVLQEIKQYSNTIPPSALQSRLDLRDLPLVTIDGEDAKDFDDAVYCEEKRGGGFRLYVAIADVSYYVKPNTALDVEAQLRGNSVYFPGKVIPMLPEVLSNGLCSLKPEEDRLCLVCVLNISEEGKLGRYEFHEAVMRSKARLTYTKVAQILVSKSESLIEQYRDILPHLENLYRLYHVLRADREKRGAIEFETAETRIIFAKSGKISHIEPVRRNDAHRLIEECMLAANVATAQFLKKHKLPGLYRIHEGPPADKLADLKLFLKELGLALSGGETPTPLDYAKLLSSVQQRQDANIIQMVLLRSLSQAVYSPDNTGHFGLAYPAYAHFTSPIRRYPDLLVHRQITTVLRGKWEGELKDLASSEEAKEQLVKLAEHTSMTERRADEATRDVTRWLKCEYIFKHIGDVFDGLISGVTRFGFFVELKELYIDGLVHVANLQGDYYYFDAVRHRLLGERSGIVFKLGDSVRVKVAKVDIAERKIDFELIESQATQKSGQKSSQKSGQKDSKATRQSRKRSGGSRSQSQSQSQSRSRTRSSSRSQSQSRSQPQPQPQSQSQATRSTPKQSKRGNVGEKEVPQQDKKKNDKNKKNKRTQPKGIKARVEGHKSDRTQK